MARILGIVMLLACVLPARAVAQTPLAIVEDTLPVMEAGVPAHIVLHAHGGVLPYRWSVAEGQLPEGLSLTREGVIEGRAVKAGDLKVTVAVEDAANSRIVKELRALIQGSLVFSWLRPPQVRGDRVEGAVQLSNGTKDDFDLTFIVVAVAENGRATVLGYQHFTLRAGTNDFAIPFGQSLAHGSYGVHADAVAEIAAKNQILKRMLETPAPLPVTQGP